MLSSCLTFLYASSCNCSFYAFVNVIVCEVEIFKSGILLKDQMACMSRVTIPMLLSWYYRAMIATGHDALLDGKRPVKHVRASRVLDEAVCWPSRPSFLFVGPQ